LDEEMDLLLTTSGINQGIRLEAILKDLVFQEDTTVTLPQGLKISRDRFPSNLIPQRLGNRGRNNQSMTDLDSEENLFTRLMATTEIHS
jgi:hypothetical protein